MYLKKIIFIMIMLVMFIANTVFAVSFVPSSSEIVRENDKHYLIEKYTVNIEDEDMFNMNVIEKYIEKDNIKYSLESIDKSGGKSIENKKVSQYKVIEIDTDNQTKIFELLHNDMAYNDGEYKGELRINKNSLNVENIAEDPISYKVKKDVEFSNYTPNDLYYMPKTTTKNGIKLDLINVEWKIQSAEYIAKSEVPVLYYGTAHYEGIATKSEAPRYNVSVMYEGEVVRETVQPIVYEARYVEAAKESSISVIGLAFSIVVFIIMIIAILIFKFRREYNLGRR